MRRIILAIGVAVFSAGGAFAEVDHFVFPVPGHANWGQAIKHKVYDLNQDRPRRIAWGLSGKFAGIDPMVPLSHHKYGIEIKFIYEDGQYDWFEPTRKFTVKDPGWQHFSGVYMPSRAVKQAQFFYRLATPGEAWYDGVTLFEVDGSSEFRVQSSEFRVDSQLQTSNSKLQTSNSQLPCKVATTDDGEITLENGYLCCTILPNEGATVRELRDVRTGINYSGEDMNRRMLLDKLRQGGEAYRKQWKAEVKKSAPDEVIVEARVSGVGSQYLDIMKTFTLKRESSALEVRYSWHNQPASMAEMVIEPWVVNGLSPRGSKGQGIYYPTAKGVVSVGPVGGTVKHSDVIGGWYAAHGEVARTMAFQFDWSHYAETWFFLAGDDNLVSDMIGQPVKIPAGGTVSREISFFPLCGVERPDWVENGIAAEIVAQDGKLAVKFDAAEEGAFNVEVSKFESLKVPKFESSKPSNSQTLKPSNTQCKVEATDVRRRVVFVGPDRTATFTTDLAAADVELVEVRLYSSGALAFEAERAFKPGHTYRPKREKAKPAVVKPFELTLGCDLVTPHADFAKPYAGGKPKVLFLTSIHQAREIVELLQRIDMDARTVRVAFSENTTSWAMIEQFGTYKYHEMNVSLNQELEKKFDVIVVSGNLMDVVDKANRAEIEQQIGAGAGYIRIGKKLPEFGVQSLEFRVQSSGSGDNSKLQTSNSKLQTTPDAAAKKWIAGNVSPELLPFKAGNVRAAEVGSHREVMLDYDAKMGLTPFVPYTGTIPPFRYQDYSLGVVGRAILWAAKMNVTAPQDAETVQETVKVEPGFTILHTFRKGPKGVYDWTAEARHEKKTAEFKAFEVQKDDTKIGATVKGRLETTGGKVRVELTDGFGRLLDFADGVTGEFALKVPEARTGMLFVDAYLTVGANGALGDRALPTANYQLPTNVVDVRHAKVVCGRPWKRAEYPLCISEGWITYSGEKQYLLKPRMEVYHNLGIDLIRFWSSHSVDSYLHILPYGFDLDFSIYDTRIGDAFFKNFHDPYAKTKDKKFLCRQPCLHDPEYRKTLDAKTRANVERIARFCPYTCDCGDENTLTRWTKPFDFCFSEHTLKAFREWLSTQYADLMALNAAWGTKFKAWGEVTPDTTEEARARAERTGRKSYAAWADHRRFMEITFCETIDRVGRILHEKLPEVPLDMSGTQAPNGWTGMDMWLISKSIGEPAAYAEGYLGDLVRSFGRPFVNPWIGYGILPKATEQKPWEFAFRFLDVGIYFWTCFNFLLPDYSPTPTAVQYGKTGDELRRGTARLLRSLEYRHKALVHYSYGSIHAAQIEDRYQDFLKANKKWCDAFTSRSIPYRYVAYAEVEDGALDRTDAKILILPHSSAISDKEAAAIRRFAERGGTVIGDEQTGRMDQHCALRKEPILRDVIKMTLDLGPVPNDGIAIYAMSARPGVEGRYWGFVRSADAGEGVAERKIDLAGEAYVYDLRKKKCLGRVKSFTVALRAGEVAFYAALPYEVGKVKVEVSNYQLSTQNSKLPTVTVQVQAGVPGLSKACHPVIVDVYSPDGKRSRLYSGVCDAKGGKGEYAFRMALNDPKGTWRVAATDYITGETVYAAFEM